MTQQEIQFPPQNSTPATYKVSYSHSLLNEQHGITDQVKDLLKEYFFDVGKGKKSLIKRLERACKKYPKVPQFKNYLSQEYQALGQHKKAKEVNDWLLEVHPNYLLGRINKAHTCMDAGNINRVPEILGKTMELQALYPDRDEFHVDEVVNFYATTMRYFLETGDDEQAETRLDLLKEIAPDAEVTRFARNQFLFHNMEENFRKTQEIWDHDLQIERTVESRDYRISTQTDVPPKFHHQEIQHLYESGFDIDEEVFREILSLPRETLITDLKAVLEDTINRFEYFLEEAEDYGWDETKYNFNIHAVYLLAALGSEESLPAVLELFRQGDEFLDFWYADRLEEFFAGPVAELASGQLEVLDDFLREPDNSYYARNIAVSALEIITQWYPERKEEVTALYEQWLRFLVDNYEDERIYDTNLLGYIIWSAVNIQAEKLLPLIQELYEKDLVPLSMIGDYKSVEEDILHPPTRQQAKPFDLFNKYREIHDNPLYNYELDTSYMSNNTDKPVTNLSPKTFKKLYKQVEPEMDPFKDVGRNAPCPCGSGRKFKKCCME